MPSTRKAARPRDAPGAEHPERPGGDIYRRMVESVRDYAIFALDVGGRIVTWNPGAQQLKGYREDEILGRHFSVFYPDEDIARGKPAHELEIASDVGRFEDEGWRLRADGSRFWANVVITAMRDRETGDLLGFAKVTRDITDRHQGEEALRRSEERFRLLVEGVQDYAVVFLDPDGRVQSWNRGAERLLGYRAGEIVGKHVSEFYGADAGSQEKARLELETAFRAGRYEEEGWRVRKDGSRFWASVVVTPLREAADGKLVGFSKVTRDLTERRRAEDTLRRAYTDLEAFSYTVSHDLRAPLRSIHMLAEAALDEALPVEARTHLQAIVRSADEGSALVDNILRFARASAGDLRRDVVDLAALARSLASGLAATARRPVAFEVTDSPAMTVRGDEPLLRIALENLLSNAWKFSQRAEAPRVTFAHERARQGGAFVVRDNGVGFDAARAGELFTPFRRLHAQHEFPGTGIGLATVQRIVERHGGRAWAEGAPGKGAAFFFTLGPPGAKR